MKSAKKNQSLLSIQDLAVEFSSDRAIHKAVHSISFEVPSGKTVALVGESGSGKSVTALSVMQLIPQPPGKITQGKIFFENQDLLQLKDSEMRKIRGNDISMIFQEPMTSLNPVFTVGYQVSEVLKLHRGLKAKEAWDLSIDLLDQVGIVNPSQKIKSYPHELSGGQKQRVMIAMAVGCQPKLLIADEPTTALDVTIQKQVLELLESLKEKYNMSMLFITHDLGIVSEIADEVVVMRHGHIVEQGSVQQIFKKAQQPYTKGLLACRPRLDIQEERLLTIDDFIESSEAPKNKKKKTVKKKKKESSDEAVLVVKNLKKYFPVKGGFWGRTLNWVKAVDDVSFEVSRGQTLGLVGESGCGKTTLGRALLRLVEVNSGSIHYEGTLLNSLKRSEMRRWRRKLQIIFQDPYASLNPRMTIGNAIMEPLKIHKLFNSKKERLKRVIELLERVGLGAEHLNRFPHEFSGGQRQRVCIARCLAVEPEFIVCDESVSALDVSIQAQILNLLKDLQDELGLTYIFISHDLAVVKFISDQVAVMKQGRFIEMNTADEIYKNPQQEYTKTLLDAIPSAPQF